MTKRKPPTNAEIGAKVRAARVKAGLTQPELGEKIGRKVQSVSKYEKGEDALTVVMLATIAIALDCKTTDLLP